MEQLPRKKQEYKEKQTELAKTLGIENKMAIPSISKIIVNIGSGKIKDDNSLLEQLQEDMSMITGQKAIVTRSKKAVASFKIRENMPVGIKVTLRGNRMWEFYDKLVSIVLPRVKDFRGVSPTAFDGKGNYALGMNDQSVFPEIDTSKVIKYHPLQVVICTTAANDAQAKELLRTLGMPFKKDRE